MHGGFTFLSFEYLELVNSVCNIDWRDVAASPRSMSVQCSAVVYYVAAICCCCSERAAGWSASSQPVCAGHVNRR